jgi:HEPN domain-containing protein
MSEPRQTDPRQWSEAARWLSYVDEDLRAIEKLMAGPTPAFRSAAFHCHQAAEKIAKAMPIAWGSAIPKIHDIEELSARVREKDETLGQALAGLASLTGWYIAVRYPDVELDFAPTSADVTSALTQLQNLRRRVDALAPKP